MRHPLVVLGFCFSSLVFGVSVLKTSVSTLEKVGGTIGYQIRLESCVSTKTLATFCTYGVLLRSLCGGLEMLESLTHIIIDEIHERDAMSDFLLTVIRDALSRYRQSF